MFQRKNELLPKNPVLRRTLYGLLLLAPAIPLTSCDPRAQFGDCGAWEKGRIKESEEIALRENEPVPSNPSCSRCPEGQGSELLLSCAVKSVDEEKRTYRLACEYEWCNPNDGRRPEGLQEPRWHEADCLLGALTAQMAWLEAASVPAFLRLAEELTAHGAPESLVKAARRSAGDEVRHTRVMKELAQRHGARMPEVDIAPFEPRSLEAMLLENAVEGCVRETFGALVAGWQARTAGDVELRRALRPIARDELRHSELAWAIDAWAAGFLAPPERERILEARREALRALEQEAARKEPPERLVREAGMPSREQALNLLHGLAVLVA